MAASMLSPSPAAKGARVAGGTGVVAGIAGIVASSCCVLPIVLAGFGLGSVAAAVIPALAALRPYLLAAAVLAVVFAWVGHARSRRAASEGATCGPAAPPRRALVWLGLASVVVLLALIWQPLVEPRLLVWMR